MILFLTVIGFSLIFVTVVAAACGAFNQEMDRQRNVISPHELDKLVFTSAPEIVSLSELRFADDAPTFRQFRYAIILGIPLPQGVSFKSISPLIDRAKQDRSQRRGKKFSDDEISKLYDQILERSQAERDIETAKEFLK